jgi:hypothetical protein
MFGGGPSFSPPPPSEPTVFDLPPAPPAPAPPSELTGGKAAPTNVYADPDVQERVAAAGRQLKRRKGRRQTVLAGSLDAEDAPEGVMATTLLGGGRLADGSQP